MSIKKQTIPLWMKRNICHAILTQNLWPDECHFHSWVAIFREIKRPWNQIFYHWGSQEINGEICLVSNPYAGDGEKISETALEFGKIFDLDVSFSESDYGEACQKIIFRETVDSEIFSKSGSRLEMLINFHIREAL